MRIGDGEEIVAGRGVGAGNEEEIVRARMAGRAGRDRALPVIAVVIAGPARPVGLELRMNSSG